MDCKIERNGERTAVFLAGQLVEGDRRSFETVIDTLVEAGAREIEIDLSRLTYMDSIGLGLLVTLHGRARHLGTSVVLKQPNGNVREFLESAAIDRLMPTVHV